MAENTKESFHSGKLGYFKTFQKKKQLSTIVAVDLVVLDSILSCLLDTKNDSEISQRQFGEGASRS